MTDKTKTCLPNTITQTTGGKFQGFSNLNNLKKKSDYAQTALVHGKKENQNRPSTVTVKNFKANLPTGALATKITVRYKHSKVAYQNKHCNVPAPTISLMNGDTVMKFDTAGKAMSKKGQAPTSTAKEEVVSFKHNWNYDELNPSTFGVRIDYPTNANNNGGYIRLYYVEITIEYRPANFTVTAEKVQGEYNGDEYIINYTVSNPNNVRYIPSVYIYAPAGFTFTDYGILEGNTLNRESLRGTLTIVDAGQAVWTPRLGWGRGSDMLAVRFHSDLTFASGVESRTVTFNIVESLAEHEASVSVTVLKTRPVDASVDPVDDDGYTEVDDSQMQPTTYSRISAKEDELFFINIQFTEAELTGRTGFAMLLYENPQFTLDDFHNETAIS